MIALEFDGGERLGALGQVSQCRIAAGRVGQGDDAPVSYTHLTLPTSDLV